METKQCRIIKRSLLYLPTQRSSRNNWCHDRHAANLIAWLERVRFTKVNFQKNRIKRNKETVYITKNRLAPGDHSKLKNMGEYFRDHINELNSNYKFPFQHSKLRPMWLPMRLRLRKLQKAATSPSKFLIEIKDHVSETTFFAFPVRKLGHIT